MGDGQAMTEITTTPAAEERSLLPVYAQAAIEPVSGRGVWLRTRDGREVLDFYGGHAVALLGYAHPRLLGALARQAEELFFQSNVVPLAGRARAARRPGGGGPPRPRRALPVNKGA